MAMTSTSWPSTWPVSASVSKMATMRRLLKTEDDLASADLASQEKRVC
jgi:hypothetical protein